MRVSILADYILMPFTMIKSIMNYLLKLFKIISKCQSFTKLTKESRSSGGTGPRGRATGLRANHLIQNNVQETLNYSERSRNMIETHI